MHLTQVLSRRLIFVGGKGGVGKTVVSKAMAENRAETGAKTLWVTFEDPSFPLGKTRKISKTLEHLNAQAQSAFEEYMHLKLGALGVVAKLFLNNKLIQALSQIAPGLHELVLLGKVWFERNHYDHVVVDMPSTGYNLAMFHSTANYARLFKGGPIHKDAEAMLGTFSDSKTTAHVIVTLPEEMPLQESLELKEKILALFPRNTPFFVVNRRIPYTSKNKKDPNSYPDPLTYSLSDYIDRRASLEQENLKILSGNDFTEIPWLENPNEMKNYFEQNTND
jgi:anion-transporting  ArsA/GET3 family ATPase